MVILTLAEYGIDAGRSVGETGVWIDAEHPLKARILRNGGKSKQMGDDAWVCIKRKCRSELFR